MINTMLLVEDDDNCAFLIKEFFEENNFIIDVVNTVTNAISNIKIKSYSIIILDINLPDFNGFEILKFLNKYKRNIPVIVTSGYIDKKIKLQSFRLGAYDYMSKPIDPEELEARVWVQLKNNSYFKEEMPNKKFLIKDNNIFFNENNLKLTKTEFKILKFLIKNKNQIVKREALITSFLSNKYNSRSLDYHIKNIRLKIGENGTNSKHLITEYGIGYKLIY